MGLFADGDRGYPDHFADSGNHRSLWTFGSDGGSGRENHPVP